MGEGTKEATIKEWFVKEGDNIAEFDDICEVFTDKLVAKIPSTADGVIKSIKFQEDEVAQVGMSLAEIEIEGEGIAAAVVETPTK